MYGLERYLGIEKDFIEAKFYVAFNQDAVYSEFFTREIILLGAEIEAALKELCNRIDGSTPGCMSDYKRIILSKLPNIVSISVCEKQSGKPISPFENWDKGVLNWWSVYTGIKHNLVDSKATLGVALTMLQAYLVLIFCVTAMKQDIHINVLNAPKLFQVGFELKGSALLQNMEMITIYDRGSVLGELGYSEG